MFGACAVGSVSPDFHGPTARGEPAAPAMLLPGPSPSRSVLPPAGLSSAKTAARRCRAALLCVRIGRGSNRLLDEGGVAHVEELARLVQLESRLADVPAGAKLDVGPGAGRARLAAELRGETLAVGLEARRAA